MDDAPTLGGHQSGSSTGDAAPVAEGGSGTMQPSSGGYACEFPGCGRVFSTKTGRGVHQQRGHKDWYDSRQDTTRVKARWSPEDSAILARREAQLTLQGVVFLNQELLKVIPDRTLEAIKGQRRKKEYKAMVERFLNEMRSADTTASPPTIESESPVLSDTNLDPHPPDTTPDDLYHGTTRDLVSEFLQELPSCDNRNLNADALNRIVRSINTWDKTRIFEEITIFLRETFPIRRKASVHRALAAPESVSRRKLRRAEYARVQKAWKKNRTTCLRDLLKDKRTTSAPPERVMVPFWEKIMTSGDTVTPGATPAAAVLTELWAPISPKEIRAALPPLGTAPGPDGFTAKEFRNVPIGIWTRIFNIFIVCGKLPQHLLESRTTLIPKKDGASEPGDFRPITVSSTITRAFHKVLANRMSKLIPVDPRQKAFRPIDGCSENIFLMDFILKFSRQSHQPLFMASLDVAKAFDSVTHRTIVDTLRSAGIPNAMVEYIAGTYDRSNTRLQCGDWESHAIHPTCGVKQGDPLSPIIFNLVIDRLFSKLPKEVGVRVGNSIVNAIGYADDLVLFALSPAGLQQLLDVSAMYLRECGLHVNRSKCFTVSLKTVPKQKKTVVDVAQSFTCLGHPIPALKRTDEWKYLGVPFTPEGRLMKNPLDRVKQEINILSTAPLKPQQRLFALRTVLLPALYHLLVLGSTNISLLNKLDATLRKAVRKWLDLPHDAPNAYFHADVKDGGLSIPSLRWIIPLQRFNRLGALKIIENDEVPVAMKQFIDSEVKRAQLRLNDHGHSISSLTLCKARFSRLLHQSNDGRPLERSRDVMRQHAWLTDGSLFVSGHDFIHMNKVRINAIPLRTRMARGRIRDRHCRAGCGAAETLQHVLQQCHRTHDARIKRHDACLEYLLRQQQASVTIEREPRFKISETLMKPDAIIKNGNKAIVIDAQIVGERVDLDRAHRAKIEKYRVLEQEVCTRYTVDKVIFTSLTLSSRGIWSGKSFGDLTTLGLLKLSDAKIMSTRALIGGLHALNIFNRRTTARRRSELLELDQPSA